MRHMEDFFALIINYQIEDSSFLIRDASVKARNLLYSRYN